jgi:hypothetical protein
VSRTFALLLVAALAATTPLMGAQGVTQPALKAAFLFNFAKFVEWPADMPASLTLCVVDDSAVEDALEQLVLGGVVAGRPVAVLKNPRTHPLRICHLLYLTDTDPVRLALALDEVKGARILTVGDGDQFVRTGGMIGLFLEDGRMRFAINPEAAQRAGVRLSSRLLSLAKIVKEGRNGQS